MVLVHRLERAEPLRIATWGATLICLGFGLLPWFPHPAWAVFTVCVWSVGEMLSFPFVAGSIGNRAGNRIGAYMGVYNVAFSLAFVVGPLAGGWAYERFGPRAPWVGCLALAPLVALGYRDLARAFARSR
jgi:predicted MFS family arabinose efflux permease